MAVTMWILRHSTALLTVPVAGMVYVAALLALGTFHQPDMALVLELLPARLRQRLPILPRRP
jgi:hypothetical protein